MQPRRAARSLAACLLFGATLLASPLADPAHAADCGAEPAPGVNWSSCDKSGLDLAGVDLTAADLSGTNLSNADLTGSILTNANLQAATLTGATLNDVTWGATPTGSSDAYTMIEGTTLDVTTTQAGVLANDSDPNAFATRTAILQGVPTPPVGLTLNANGTFGYTPPSGFQGLTTFKYVLKSALPWVTPNPSLFSDPITVTISVASHCTLPPAPQVDWSGCHKEVANLIGADLSSANLNGANFTEASLTQANLSNATMTGTVFTRATLIGANMNGAGMLQASFTESNVENATFDGASMHQANFDHVNARGAYLGNADMSQANFTGADMAGAVIFKSDLTNANLTGADLTGATINQSGLVYTNLRNAVIVNATVINTSLSGANLIGADLTGTDLATNDLTNVIWGESPVARNDTFVSEAGKTLTRSAAEGPLNNDDDPNRFGSTTVTLRGAAPAGLILQPDGSFSYAPPPGFLGSVSFDYRVSSTVAWVLPASTYDSADATVTILVDDDIPPDQPIVTSPGSFNTPTPTIKGKAEPGATVIITVDGVTYTTIADADGNWEIVVGPLSPGYHDVTIVVKDPAGNSSSPLLTRPFVNLTYLEGSGFTPFEPTRRLDTRSADGTTGRERLSGNRPLTINMRGFRGIPDDATGVSINLTPTDSSEAGWIAVYSCAQGFTGTSTANFLPGQPSPNAAYVALDENGEFCVLANVDVHVIIDVNGYFSVASESRIEPVSPTRVIDTRQSATSRLRVDETRVLSLPVAVGTVAVTVEVIIDRAGGSGFLTIWSCSGPRPDTSYVNSSDNLPRSNQATVPVDNNGRICVYTSVDTDMVIDLVGVARPGLGAYYHAAAPASRIFDSRIGRGSVAAGETIQLDVRSIDPSTTGVQLNLTTTNTEATGYLTAWDCRTPRPGTSASNPMPRRDVAKASTVSLNETMRICIYSLTKTDIVVDIMGLFT